MVLGHGVSSLTWKVVTLGAASGCCLYWGVLQLGAEGYFLSLGPLCRAGDSLQFPLCQIIYSHWNEYGC